MAAPWPKASLMLAVPCSLCWVDWQCSSHWERLPSLCACIIQKVHSLLHDEMGPSDTGHSAHINLTQQWLRSGQLHRLLSMGSCNCILHQSQALQAMPDAFVLSVQHVLAAYQEPICRFDG